MAERSDANLSLVECRCLKIEDRKRNVDGDVLADLAYGLSREETSVCCVLQEPSLVTSVAKQ